MKSGIDLITDERERQAKVHGYTDECILGTATDYGNGQLSVAAAIYALPEPMRPAPPGSSPYQWPWPDEYWKPTPDNRIRELTKAGAMLVAEIDRLLNEDSDDVYQRIMANVAENRYLPPDKQFYLRVPDVSHFHRLSPMLEENYRHDHLQTREGIADIERDINAGKYFKFYFNAQCIEWSTTTN